MTQPAVPFPADVRTDETMQTGTITIHAETQGGAVKLRQLHEMLLAAYPGWISRRADIKHNVPDPPPTDGR